MRSMSYLIKNKLAIGISLILIFGQLSMGQDFKKVGTVGYPFLRVPVLARDVGLGEASGALTHKVGILPLFLNPAVLGFQHQGAAGISYSQWLVDIQHQAAGFTWPLGNIGNFGIGLNYFDYGSIPHTEQTGQQGQYVTRGHYTAQSIACGLTYARQLTDKFAFGTRIKWVQETIYKYSSSNIILDLGVIYFTGFQNLRLGGFVNNFGVDARFIGDSFKMPTTLRLALAYDLISGVNHLLTLVSEVSHPSDNTEKIHFGVEYGFHQYLYFRAGYKYKYDEDHFNFGAGLSWQGLLLDAALIPFGKFNTVYMLTLQKEF